MSCVPPSANTFASKPTPARCLLGEVAADEPWQDAVERFATRNPRRHQRLAEYEAILASGQHREIATAVLAGRHRPAAPTEVWLNKADGRKKRVFQFPPADELLFRVVNRLVQPVAAECASRWCRSFLPGANARTAFRDLLADPRADAKAALRLDVRDYFNSIDPIDLLARLPDDLADGPLRILLEAWLLDLGMPRAGVMAGTPLAPLLATLYLRDLDREVAHAGADVTYARYSDDMIVLAPVDEIGACDELIRRRLAERGLEVNEAKSAVAGPGEPWDFLGFRYHDGTVGLSPMTVRKVKARATRLARRTLRWRERSAVPAEVALAAYVRRTNWRTYAVPRDRAEFSWGTWFLPMMSAPGRLPELDEHVQREARYAATGRRTAMARREVPHRALQDAGYLPLVTAFWAVRESHASYEALVERRAGLSVQATQAGLSVQATQAGLPSVGRELRRDDAGQVGPGGGVDPVELEDDPVTVVL